MSLEHQTDEHYEAMQLDYIKKYEDKLAKEKMYERPAGITQVVLDATVGVIVRLGNEG